MKLLSLLRIIWKPKGGERRPIGILLHFAGGVLVVGLPFYFTTYSFGFGFGLVIGAGAFGVWKEIIEWKLRGAPPNLLDIVPWFLGGLVALLVIGIGEKW